MKNRVLTALLIAVLALPALAQTSSAPSPDQNQNQAQAQSTSSQPAAVTTVSTDSATGKPLQPPAREGFWGHMNPLARKKYVQRQVGANPRPQQ